MSATNRLTCRVSDEVKEKFEKLTEGSGLSTNQWLKLYILLALGYEPPEIPDGCNPADEMAEWLRGK